MLEVRADKVMTSPVVSVREETPLSEVIRMLYRHRISGVPVLDSEERVVGIISERDVLKYSRLVVGRPIRDPGMLLSEKEEIAHVSSDRGMDIIEAVAVAKAAQVMSDRPHKAREDTSLLEIVRLMNRHEINRVPVVDETGRLKGIISRADILKELEKWVEKA